MQTRALPKLYKMQTNLVYQNCRQSLSTLDKVCLSWNWRWYCAAVSSRRLSAAEVWQQHCLAGGSLNRRCAQAEFTDRHRRSFATSERCWSEKTRKADWKTFEKKAPVGGDRDEVDWLERAVL